VRGFGRRFSPDDRDRAFLMRRMLAGVRSVALPSRKSWPIAPKALNQGSTGTCVGHAWRNFLRCAPIQLSAATPSAYDIYRIAVKLDEWRDNDAEARLPDGDPRFDSGTSVRAGARALSRLGHLQSYVWAFALQPALEWVLTRGPVVLGINWYTSFDRPDREGIVRIGARAKVDDGHVVLWRGADTRRALAFCTNSWGDRWGRSGDFALPFRDLERLIHEDGEVCTAVQRRLSARRVLPPAAKAFR
jgi:hypothetical protein